MSIHTKVEDDKQELHTVSTPLCSQITLFNSFMQHTRSRTNCSLNTFPTDSQLLICTLHHTALLWNRQNLSMPEGLSTYWNFLSHKAGYSSFSSQFINHILKSFLIIIIQYIFFLLIVSDVLSEVSLPLECKHCELDFLSGSLLPWCQEQSLAQRMCSINIL